ncbi:MAG: DMT family transporter [Clostridia bacterium]|nr:DMT family transporter [Clostridia bacterium]
MKKTYLFAGISIFFWSTVAVTTKLLLGAYDNIQVLWASVFFAGASLVVFNVATGNIKKIKSYTAKDYFISMLIGLPGTFFYYIFYYAGADMMLASQAFIINYLWPIMSVLFACIILKEKMTVRKVVAIAMSFFGVVVVTSGELLHFNKVTLLGALFCVFGAVSYGIFTALNQKKHYDKSITMMISYAATFVLTTVLNAAKGDLFVPSLGQTLGFAWNGIFTMAIANTLWVIALGKGKTAKVSNLAYITPFLSLVWTGLILKEELSIFSVIGLVIIVSGIFIQLKEKAEPKHSLKIK